MPLGEMARIKSLGGHTLALRHAMGRSLGMKAPGNLHSYNGLHTPVWALCLMNVSIKPLDAPLHLVCDKEAGGGGG